MHVGVIGEEEARQYLSLPNWVSVVLRPFFILFFNLLPSDLRVPSVPFAFLSL